MGAALNGNQAVGQNLASVLPQDSKSWYSRGYLLKLNFILISLVMFSSSNGYDGSLMNGLQALPLWHDFMDMPTGAWLGFINAIYWLGTGICYPIAAWVANKYGRKLGVYIGYGFLVLGVTLQTACRNDITFLMARFFLGCASAWFGNAVPCLINEIAYPTHRGVANALFNCGWYVGSIVAAFVTFGTRNYTNSWGWRVPSLLQVLIPVVALPGFIMAPESPRFLCAQGKPDQARQILADAHAGGDSSAPLIEFEMIEIETTLRAEQAAKDSSSYRDIIRTKGNRDRLFISVSLGIFSQWAGNGVVSYYLALVLNTVGITEVSDQLLISAGLQIWNLIFAVGAAFCVDRLGRRMLFLTSAATMLISYIIITGLSGSFAQSGHAATGVAVVPFLFIYFAGYDIALTPFLVAYPCEIWPYSFRAKGLSITWISTVLAIFFNTFINPIALEAIGWKYYFVFVFVLVIFGITAYFYYPETRGYSLEQIAFIFDGEDADLPNPEETKERSASISAVTGVNYVPNKAEGEKVASHVEERV